MKKHPELWEYQSLLLHHNNEAAHTSLLVYNMCTHSKWKGEYRNTETQKIGKERGK